MTATAATRNIAASSPRFLSTTTTKEPQPEHATSQDETEAVPAGNPQHQRPSSDSDFQWLAIDDGVDFKQNPDKLPAEGSRVIGTKPRWFSPNDVREMNERTEEDLVEELRLRPNAAGKSDRELLEEDRVRHMLDWQPKRFRKSTIAQHPSHGWFNHIRHEKVRNPEKYHARRTLGFTALGLTGFAMFYLAHKDHNMRVAMQEKNVAAIARRQEEREAVEARGEHYPVKVPPRNAHELHLALREQKNVMQ
jgi:hypothetical protein